MRIAWVLLAACGDQLVPPDAPLAPTEYHQPRLATVGMNETVAYDDAGHPTAITALYSSYTLTWTANQLARAELRFIGFGLDHAVVTIPTYDDGGRLATLDSTCSGACVAPDRRDRFIYDGARLVTWNVSGWGASRAYQYDTANRLVMLPEGEIAYGNALCPISLTPGPGLTPFEFSYDDDGRLVKAENAIDYQNGLITRFEGTGTAFDDLTYVTGIAVGLDLWPGAFNGGFVYGFPALDGVWRLDGTCDPTMTSQSTILMLALTSTLRSSTPAGGT